MNERRVSLGNRVISLLLALVMVVGMLPAGLLDFDDFKVSAASTTTTYTLTVSSGAVSITNNYFTYQLEKDDEVQSAFLPLAKNAQGYIEFTVSSGATATVTIVASSTNSSNESDLNLVNTSTEDDLANTTVSGTSQTTKTFENVPAGTYRIQSTAGGRDVRIYSVTVVETVGDSGSGDSGNTGGSDSPSNATVIYEAENDTKATGVTISGSPHDKFADLTINGQSFTKALKFDSKGLLTYVASADGVLTFYVGTQEANYSVKVTEDKKDGTTVATYTISKANVAESFNVNVTNGKTYVFSQKEGETGLYMVTFAPTTSHTHTAGDIVPENEVAATCTTAGSYDEVVYCTDCGEEISRTTETIAALGHSYNDGVQTTAPTCTAEGVKTLTCTVCGTTKTEPVPATGHEYGDGTTCTVCGAIKRQFVEVSGGTDAQEFEKATELKEGQLYVIGNAEADFAHRAAYWNGSNWTSQYNGGSDEDPVLNVSGTGETRYTLISGKNVTFWYWVPTGDNTGYFQLATDSTKFLSCGTTEGAGATVGETKTVFTVNLDADTILIGSSEMYLKVEKNGAVDAKPVDSKGKIPTTHLLVPVEKYYAIESLSVSYDQNTTTNIAADIAGKLVWWEAADINGTDAAKLTAAPNGVTVDTSAVTVATPGTYNVPVKVNGTTVDTVSVTVNRVDSYEVAITGQNSMIANTSIQLSAALKLNGETVSGAEYIWSVSSGATITQDGMLTVDGTAENVTVTVTATSGDVTKTATFDVTVMTPTAAITGKDAITAGDNVGETYTITLSGVSTSIYTVEWNVTGATYTVSDDTHTLTINKATAGTNVVIGAQVSNIGGSGSAAIAATGKTVTVNAVVINTLTYELIENFVAGGEYVIVAVVDGKAYALKNPDANASDTVPVVLEVEAGANFSTVTFDSASDAALSEWKFTSQDGAYYVTNNQRHMRRDTKMLRSTDTYTLLTVNAKSNATGQYALIWSGQSQSIGVKDDDGTKVWNYKVSEDASAPIYLYLYQKATVTTPGVLNTLELSQTTLNVANGGNVSYSAITGTAKYDNNTSKTVANSALTFAPVNGTIDTTQAGSYEVTVSYTEGDKTVTAALTVVVAEPVVLESITLTQTTLNVANGADVNFSNIAADAAYSDDSVQRIASGSLTFTPVNGAIDTTVAGSYPVTVSYTEGGVTKQATLTVQVAEPVTLTSIEVTPETLEFSTGDLITYEGLTITAKYSDGTSKTLQRSEVTFSLDATEISNTEAKDTTVTVTYEGKTDTFVVSVEAVQEGFFLDTSGTVDWESGEYIIVFLYDKKYYALTNNNGSESVTNVTDKISNGQLNYTRDEAAKMIFTFDDTNGNQIYNGDTYLRNNDKVLNTDDTKTVYAVSSINKATGEYGIQTEADRYLYMSSTSDVKRSSSGTVKSAYLYKWSGATSSEATLSSGRLNTTEKTITAGQTLDLSGMKFFAVYSNNSQVEKTIGSDVTVDTSKVDIYTPGTYDVTYTYTEGGKTVTAVLEVTVKSASSSGTTSEIWKHNFSVDGETDTHNFYTISGNLATGKGSITYNGISMDTVLKMESSTSISFTAPYDGSFTLVFGGSTSASNKDVKINNVTQTVGSDNTLTIDVTKGTTYTITKGDSINLFYMEYVSDEVDGITLGDIPNLYLYTTAAKNPTHPMQLTVRHGEQNVTSGYTVTWTSADENIATVDSNGLVTGQKPGNTTITAKVVMDDRTEYTGFTNVAVRGPSISAAESLSLLVGVDDKDTGSIGATAEVANEATTNVEFGYFVPDSGIVEIAADGTVTAAGVGTTQIYTFIKKINGHKVYTGDGSDMNNQPPYYAVTEVTVDKRRVEYAALNHYDFFIPKGSNQTALEELLKYEIVDSANGVSDAKGLQVVVRYNDGKGNITANYPDDRFHITLSGIDYNTVDIYPCSVVVTNSADEVVLRDTIWIHVVETSAVGGDGYYSLEDGATYILDTDGTLDVNEEYVLVVGSNALKNGMSDADSSSASSAVIIKATDDSEREILTFTDASIEKASVWLLDTLYTDGGKTYMNASNNESYLFYHNDTNNILHKSVNSVQFVASDAAAGEYFVILGYDTNNNPMYLNYVDGVWQATSEPQAIQMYQRVLERIDDYKLEYYLENNNNKVDHTTPIVVPDNTKTTLIPVVIYNEDNRVTNYKITWTSSDPSVASVDENGEVTAHKKGEAIITAVLEEVDGNSVYCATHSATYITRTATIQVENSEIVPTLTPSYIEIGKGSFPNLQKVNLKMDGPGDEHDYNVTWSDLTFDMAKATRDGEVVGFDPNTLGEYKVTVHYGEDEYLLTIQVVEDPFKGLDDATAIPGFPDAGSVRIDKKATGVIDFASTGVTKLELTVAGVSTKSSVDVILIVDVSNSMGWDITRSGNDGDPNKIPTNGAAGTDKLDIAMDAADSFANILLNVPGGDNTMSFVTFAGADAQHGDSKNLDSVRMPMIGISDYKTASSVFAATEFTSLTTKNDGKDVDYKLSIGGYSDDGYGEEAKSGTNRGNTNYDFAFGKGAEAVAAMKAKWEAANPGKSYDESGRQIHVVFMTDGAPSHYNSKHAQGNADTLWNGSGSYTKGSTSADGWLSYISTHNDLATALYNQVDGFYSIGFDMENGGFGGLKWNLDQMRGVLRGLVKNNSLSVKLSDNKQQLEDDFNDLAKALAYAGTNARVTDKIGNSFSLFTGVSMYSANMVEDKLMTQATWDAMANYAGGFPINILSYRLVTAADLGATLNIINDAGEKEEVTITEAHYGLRVDEAPIVLETITFNAAGTEAYSTELDEGVNIMSTRADGVTVIDAATFTYTRTPVQVDGETITDEQIVWKINDITDREVAMQYYAYLEGSLDNPRVCEPGVYYTNEYAYAEYIDIYGDYVKRAFGMPQVAWGKAQVTVRFYLVNKAGEFVNRAGVTFSNPANRIFLDGRAYYESELNEIIEFTAQDALLNANLAGDNVLYDSNMALKVANSSSGQTGGITWEVTTDPAKLPNIDNLKIGRDNTGGSYTSVTIDIPVVMSDLGESAQKMSDSHVVIDFSNSVKWNALSVEEQGYNGWVDETTKLKYTIELVGFAKYNPNADLKDYIPESTWDTKFDTDYGTYEVVYTGEGDNKKATNEINFTPKAMLNGTDHVFAVFRFGYKDADNQQATMNFYYLYKLISVVPATVVHYETTDNMEDAFVFEGAWSEVEDATHNPGATQSNANAQYGFDASYSGHVNYAGGSSWYVENTGTKNGPHPSVKFTFTGTGIDIISKTGEDQGLIRMTLTGKDTEKAAMVINKGVDELYQIPVLSVEGLLYDTYEVEIVAYNKSSAYGGQFFFDAIKVYGSAQESEVIGSTTAGDTTVGSLYEAAGESTPQILEVRDILLGNNDFGGITAAGTDVKGAVYIDGNQSLGEGSSNFNDYDKIGPNNEVYLSNNQAVAFKLKVNKVNDVTNLPESLDIGLKSVNGSVNATVYVITGTGDNAKTYSYTHTVGSATAMFYDLLTTQDPVTGEAVSNTVSDFLGNNQEFTVVIANKDTNKTILSVTDLKVGYGPDKGKVDTVVDIDVSTNAGDALASTADVDSVSIANMDTTTDPNTAIAYAMYTTTIVVVTGQDAQGIKIVDGDGNELAVRTPYVDSDNGALRWRVLVRFDEVGKKEYTVSAIGSDGSADKEQKIVVDVRLFEGTITNTIN